MALGNLEPQKEFLPEMEPKHVTVASPMKDIEEMSVIAKMKARQRADGKSTTVRTKKKG